MTSITTSWIVYFAAAHRDASFSLMHNRVDERAISYQCCCGTSLFIIFAAALLASSFGLVRYSVNTCASSFTCCCGITLVVIFAAALLASSFSLLCYIYNKSAFCFCSCCGIFCFPFLVSCAAFSFLAAAFFYCDNNFPISFFEVRHFTVVLLGFFLVFSIYSHHVFCVLSPDIDFFSGMLIKRVAITHLWSLPM